MRINVSDIGKSRISASLKTKQNRVENLHVILLCKERPHGLSVLEKQSCPSG